MRIEIRVQPGSRSASVGGDYDGALVVRVPEAPEKGRATAAALRAVASALGARSSDVRLVAGGSSRRKIVEIDFDFPPGDPRRALAEHACARRVLELRREAGGRPASPVASRQDLREG